MAHHVTDVQQIIQKQVFMARYCVGERRWHVTIPLAISSLALASMAHTMEHSPSLAFLALLVATLAWAPNGIMYSYPATFLQGAAAATGVALINSIANIGGMIGPYLIGRVLCLCADINSTRDQGVSYQCTDVFRPAIPTASQHFIFVWTDHILSMLWLII